MRGEAFEESHLGNYNKPLKFYNIVKRCYNIVRDYLVTFIVWRSINVETSLNMQFYFCLELQLLMYAIIKKNFFFQNCQKEVIHLEW